jgi:endonuclease G
MGRLLAAFAFSLSAFLALSADAAQIPAACSTQAPWGAPTWSSAEPTLTPLCRTAYVVLHDDMKLVPDFVSWQLTAEHATGCAARINSFAPDPDLLQGHRAELADYKGHPGFDRGHFAPNADFAWDADVERQSFYLSNMSPQASHLNQWEWEQLEAATRAWTLQHPTLIVMDGPIWTGPAETIGPDHVAIPAAYWKVVVDAATHEAAAFVMKNEPTAKGDLSPFLVSNAMVEQAAGFALPLPADVDRTRTATLWSADISGLARIKARKCHPQ